jgi:hypothetical protein
LVQTPCKTEDEEIIQEDEEGSTTEFTTVSDEETPDELYEPVPDSSKSENMTEERQKEPDQNRRYPVRERETKKDDDMIYSFSCSDEHDPKTFKEALFSNDRSQWEKAMIEEMRAMRVSNIWELVDLPRDKNIVRSKWIYILPIWFLIAVCRFVVSSVIYKAWPLKISGRIRSLSAHIFFFTSLALCVTLTTFIKS